MKGFDLHFHNSKLHYPQRKRRLVRSFMLLGVASLLGLTTTQRAEGQPIPPSGELVVRALTFSRDGSSLYFTTYSSKRRLARVNLFDGSEAVLIQGDGPNYSAVTSLRDNRIVAGGYPNGIVHLIGARDNRPAALLDGFGGQTLGIMATPSDLLLIRNADILYLYDVRNDKLVRSVSFQQSGSLANGFTRPAQTNDEWPKTVHLLVGACLSPDGGTVAVSLGKSGVATFPVNAPKKAKYFETMIPYVSSLAFSPDGKTLAVGGSTPPKVGETGVGAVELFDLATGTSKQLPLEDMGETGLMAFNADGTRLILFDFSKDARRVRLWDVMQSREITSAKLKVKELMAVAVSPDGKFFAIGGDYGYEVWNLENGKCVRRSRPME